MTIIKTKIKKLIPLFQTHDSAKYYDTDVQDKKINESRDVVDSAAKSKDDTLK